MENIETSALSYNLKILRRSLGISQQELADRINIKRGNIAAYETKNVEPRLDTILKIAFHLNIDPGYLINKKIDLNKGFPPFKERSDKEIPRSNSFSVINNKDHDSFDKLKAITDLLEGFRTTYKFKRKQVKKGRYSKKKMANDFKDFIALIDHIQFQIENMK